MRVLERISRLLNQILIALAGVFLVAMVILTCADILFRIVWVPIRGSVELMGFFGATVTAFALGYTQLRGGHVSVDVLLTRFPEKIRTVLWAFNCVVCGAFFGIAAWRITQWSTTILKTGEVTETLRIIYYPFSYGVAFGCAIIALVFLIDLLRTFMAEEEVGK